MVEDTSHLPRSLFRTGGISAILLVVSYLAIIVLYVVGGTLPVGAAEALTYLAGHATTWWMILGFSVLTDFLFMVIALCLFQALKQFGRYAALTGASFIGFFVVLDLALTWPAHGTLITLSSGFIKAATEAQRALFVAAAQYALAGINSLLGVYIILIPGLGILILSLLMLKGTFNKFTAWLGVATGILATAAVVTALFADATVLNVGEAILVTVWVAFVGYRLFKLGHT